MVSANGHEQLLQLLIDFVKKNKSD